MHNGVMVVHSTNQLLVYFNNFYFFSLTPKNWILFSLGVNSTKISQFLGKKNAKFPLT